MAIYCPAMAETVTRNWDSTADAWMRWRETSERAARIATETMLDLAAIEPGHRVLDLATGLGDSAAAAARRAGASGSVMAVDKAEKMIEGARRLVAAEGLANVTFRQADLDALDLGETGFDAVICRWGLMFAEDVVRTLSAIRTMLRPGASFSTVVWGPPDRCAAQMLANRVLMETLGVDPVPTGEGTPFALSDRSGLEAAFARAGFANIESRTATVTYHFRSAEDYVRYRRERSALETRLEHLAIQERERGWAAVVAEARKLARPDRSLRIDSEAIVIAGQNAVQQYF